MQLLSSEPFNTNRLLQVCIFVLDIQHRNAEDGYDKYIQEHGAIEQMQETMHLGFKREVVLFENPFCHFLEILCPALVPSELLRS